MLEIQKNLKDFDILHPFHLSTFLPLQAVFKRFLFSHTLGSKVLIQVSGTYAYNLQDHLSHPLI